MTRRKLLLTLGAVALVLVALAAFRIWLRIHHRQEYASGMVTKPLDRGKVDLMVKSSGTLNPVVLVDVGTQVSGTLSRLYVDYNTPVKQGQTLAELDPTLLLSSLHQDEAALASAQTNLDIARKSDQRLGGLLPQGYVAQSDVDTADNALAAAQAQVQTATAAVERDRTNLGYTVIRSPVSGVVISRNVNVGQTVAASFQTPTLFVIAQDLSKMQIDLSVDEADVGHVKPGQPVTFTVEAYADKTFRGSVRMVRNDAATQQNVVTYDVVIDTHNDGLLLRPGMTASASILTQEKDQVLRVPNQALQIGSTGLLSDPGQAPARPDGWDGTIYLMQHGRPVPVWVKLGLQGDQYSEITRSSQDLDAGDEVAVGVDPSRPPSGS